MSQKTRQRFTEDFKREAVQLVLSGNRSITDVSGDLGIERYNLSRWKQEYLKQNSFDPGSDETKEQKIRRLEKENTLLRQERDILKKAMGIVSKQ